jgi:hypothetical protein
MSAKLGLRSRPALAGCMNDITRPSIEVLSNTVAGRVLASCEAPHSDRALAVHCSNDQRREAPACAVKGFRRISFEPGSV